MSGIYAKGCKKDPFDSRDLMFAAHRPVLSGGQLPSKGVLTKTALAVPVADQKTRSCCTGIGTTRAVKARMLFKEYPYTNMPSALYLYAKTRMLEGTPLTVDDGAAIRDVIKALCQFGIPPEDGDPASSWPWTPEDDRIFQTPPEACDLVAADHKLIKYLRVRNDENEIKSALAQGMPLVIGMDLKESFESDRVARTGIIPRPKPSEGSVGGHCTWVFDYNQFKNDYVDARNSWGPDWGDKGSYHIPIDMLLDPEQTSDIWALDVFTGLENAVT